ncbi:winged helix-turn-helix domain-containing protein [Nannocystis pusilla]|uniref:winged helix-turn-helix domain-containing protein n=1 Tax=Nannocystis pusilla TaxID=889268 RepID=UPI003DA696EE
MKLLEAVEVVLREAGGPLHYKEITERVLAKRLWSSEGQTPARTLNSTLAVEIQENGSESLFVRTAPGVFGLKHARPARAAGTSRSVTQETTSRKLGTQEIKNLARQIVKSHPEGIRYGQLVTLILDEYPNTPRNTVEGSVWNLDAHFPNDVHKPLRGLFKPGPAGVAEQDEPETAPQSPLREAMFYEAFADWLKRDLEDATDAVSLGGAGLRSKWSTPNVIGVYKALPSDRIKFPHEIISAEIKIDPQASVVAFGQAVAYRLFSTKSYIVMPDTISKEDQGRLEALCMLFGVGLVLFSLNPEQPDFKIRMRAQRFSPDMYFVNEFADGLHRLDKDLFNRLFQ